MKKIIALIYSISILLACSKSSDNQEIDVSEGRTNWTKYSYWQDPLSEEISYSAIGINDIKIQGDNIVIAGFLWNQEPSGRAWKSSNKGETWTLLAVGGGCGAGNSIISVEMPSERIIYALQTCLSGGTLYKSIDSGENWTLISGVDNAFLSPTEHSSQVMHFFNDTDGIISYLKTTDGGENWTEIEDLKPYSFTNTFRSLSFIDDQIGYCNTENTLFFTENGGENWSVVHENLHGSYRNIHFIDRDTGFIMTQTELLRTIDGGKSWTSVLPENIRDISFATGQIGFAAGSGGIYKTTNSGETWNLNYSSNFIDILLSFSGLSTNVKGFNTIEFQDSNFGISGGIQLISSNLPNDKAYIARTLTAGE